MLKDIKRFMPKIDKIIKKGSLYEVKTILMAAEGNDKRPILFRKNYSLKNFHIVMGGKIDNVYDILEEMEKFVSSPKTWDYNTPRPL